MRSALSNGVGTPADFLIRDGVNTVSNKNAARTIPGSVLAGVGTRKQHLLLPHSENIRENTIGSSRVTLQQVEQQLGVTQTGE